MPFDGRRSVHYPRQTSPRKPEARRQRAFDGLRRVITINRGLAAYLVLFVSFEIVSGRRSDVARDTIVSLPLALLLLIAAAKLPSREPISRGWLRVSGWTCAALALVSVLAVRTALSEPVDLSWALLASCLTSGLVCAAWYQLVRMPHNANRYFVLERLRRGFRRALSS